MTKRLLAGAVLLPLFASADTLILRNGTRYRGNFNSANANQISFTEYSGNRQSYDRADVQELQFGNDQSGAYSGSPGNTGGVSGNSAGNPSGNPGGFGRDSGGGFGNASRSDRQGNGGMRGDLDRLQQDLRAAMDNNDLSDDQRQSLDDSRATLRSALEQGGNNQQPDQRSMRLALDNIRNAADRMQPQDRDRLNEDIRRLRSSLNGQAGGQGRNY